MSLQLIKNATIINEGRTFVGSVLIAGEFIKAVYEQNQEIRITEPYTEIDASGKLLIPGVIDDQVHFREPGLTHKGDIHTESRAAVAGGVTSFMEMPNTMPLTTTIQALEDKYALGAENRWPITHFTWVQPTIIWTSSARLIHGKCVESRFLWVLPPEICWWTILKP